LNGVLESHRTFAAHFRLDTDRSVLVGISVRVSLRQPSALGIFEWDSAWKLMQKKVLNVPGLNYAHDFVLTRNWYIFHMSPFVRVSRALVLKWAVGLGSPGMDMHYHPELPSRIVLIPRDPTSTREIIQLDTIPCHIYHFSNGFESDDGLKIEFLAVCLPTNMTMEFEDKIWLSNAQQAPGRLHSFEVTLHPTDPKQHKCSAKLVDPSNCEFPTAHPYRNLHRCRYTYLMANDRKEDGYPLPYRDIVKYDAQLQARQTFRSHGVVGEPLFVPRTPWYPGKLVNSESEDDGWVICQLYNPNTRLTEFIVLDGANLDKGPVVRIKLHHFVPYAFHGTFTPHVFVFSPSGGTRDEFASPSLAGLSPHINSKL